MHRLKLAIVGSVLAGVAAWSVPALPKRAVQSSGPTIRFFRAMEPS